MGLSSFFLISSSCVHTLVYWCICTGWSTGVLFYFLLLLHNCKILFLTYNWCLWCYPVFSLNCFCFHQFWPIFCCQASSIEFCTKSYFCTVLHFTICILIVHLFAESINKLVLFIIIVLCHLWFIHKQVIACLLQLIVLGLVACTTLYCMYLCIKDSSVILFNLLKFFRIFLLS